MTVNIRRTLEIFHVVTLINDIYITHRYWSYNNCFTCIYIIFLIHLITIHYSEIRILLIFIIFTNQSLLIIVCSKLQLNK